MENPILNRSRIRTINGGFGFIPHAFNQKGYLSKLGGNELLLYFFLILVADQNGVSYYSDLKICRLLDLSAEDLLAARDQLVAMDLLAFAHPIYQVLELP